jgi:hypothetical protein
MTSMSSFVPRQSTILIFLACAFILTAPLAQAGSSNQADKHARKVEKRLAKYREGGAFLEVDLRDNSELMGYVAELSDSSFRFTDSDNNKTASFAYADVTHVKKTKEYIGAGSEGRRVRLWVPLVLSAAAAGGAVAAFEATR